MGTVVRSPEGADGPVERALLIELTRMGALADSALAAAAVMAAKAIDRGDGRMPDLLGEFRQYLAQLRELAPPVPIKDGVSDLRAAREARRTG
jgi:hypothetical protein